MKTKYPNKMNWSCKVIEKIWARVAYPEDWIKGADNSKICIEWCGAFDKFKRPIFRLNGYYVLAKRVMFESFYGPIDDDKVISNKCFNQKCVRPDHLQQNYFFIRETCARNGQKDPKDRRKKLRVTIKEVDMLNVFNGVKEGWLKSVPAIGEFLNIDDSDVIELMENDQWQFINNYYTKHELDKIRAIVGLSPQQ